MFLDVFLRIIGQDVEAIRLQQEDNARRRAEARQRELDIENDILDADRYLLEFSFFLFIYNKIIMIIITLH
jgi:hypothetical protein